MSEEARLITDERGDQESSLTKVLPTVVKKHWWENLIFLRSLGILVFLFVWWLAGDYLRTHPSLQSFSKFAPGPTLAAFLDFMISVKFWQDVGASLGRVAMGLIYAIVFGSLIGLAIGLSTILREIFHFPIQMLRMISPLAWMPIAILAFATWDSAIIFLIGIAAVWPIAFSTSNSIGKISPSWVKGARNLGATSFQMLKFVIFPAIASDLFSGIRLAVGVAWIVLVPAEYLGVTSGLGYAINDARDTLSYDKLAAVVIMIGLIGICLDRINLFFINKYHWKN